MSDLGGSLPPTTGFDDTRRIDAVCDAFELAWKQNGGTQPSLLEYLERLPVELRKAAVLELLPIEISYLRRRGATIPLDDYRKRFPFAQNQLEEWLASGSSPQAPSRVMPGDRLGKYTIAECIGAGGMGEVYRALDSTLGREVAIKVLHSRLTCNAEALVRIELEAQVLAALNHPHIVTVHELDQQDGLAYLVLELLDGETLAERLERAPLAASEVLDLACQLAAALAVAHQKRIVHRDLKPRNIFLTKDGQAKILDFGLARLLEQPAALAPQQATSPARHGQTIAGARLGTAGYMSPEQVRGQAVDARSDVFSFGCVLFEMVTGTPAFVRSTVEESHYAVQDEPAAVVLAAPLSDLVPIISRCLEKAPQRRYASAVELSSDLARVQASQQQRKGRTLRRVERAAMVLLCVALLILGGWLVRRAELAWRLWRLSEACNASVIREDIDELKRNARQILELSGSIGSPADSTDPLETRQKAIGTGFMLLERGTYADIMQAIEWFKIANSGDTKSALAHVGLAECYYHLSSVYRDPVVSMENMKAEAEAALQLDPAGKANSSAVAYALLGLYHHRHLRDWGTALQHFVRAEGIDAESAIALRIYGNSLVLQGQFSKGIIRLEKALDKDQGSPDLMVDLGLAFLYAQQYTEAELKFREVLRKHPDHFPARWAFGELRLHQGLHLESQGDDSAAQDKYSEAIVELRRACKLDPQSPEAKAELAFCLGKLPSPANRSRARRIVNELHHRAGQNKPGERYVSFTALAVAQLGEGDRQNAMANLTKGVAAKEEWLIWLKVDPVFQALSSDDFKEIHDAIGLWSQTE